MPSLRFSPISRYSLLNMDLAEDEKQPLVYTDEAQHTEDDRKFTNTQASQQGRPKIHPYWLYLLLSLAIILNFGQYMYFVRTTTPRVDIGRSPFCEYISRLAFGNISNGQQLAWDSNTPNPTSNQASIIQRMQLKLMIFGPLWILTKLISPYQRKKLRSLDSQRTVLRFHGTHQGSYM